MIKFNEMKQGNRVEVLQEGQWQKGIVGRANADDGGQIEIMTGVQTAWYAAPDIRPIKLEEEALLELGFEKEVQESGNIKYKYGPFRVLIGPTKRFTDFLMWYREEKSHITYEMTLHQFQNRYEQMTKVPLG
ncbi:MAG: hypothetical protein EAY75_09145 [Bacteroidetes bacterium]|nr:MAG: hypothetical protein EAY75_09145 [Bacteroidota bacterium]